MKLCVNKDIVEAQLLVPKLDAIINNLGNEVVLRYSWHVVGAYIFGDVSVTKSFFSMTMFPLLLD